MPAARKYAAAVSRRTLWRSRCAAATSQPPQRYDLLFLVLAQDIAHLTERNRPARLNVPGALPLML